jgi:hypothetical protein
VKSFDLFFLLVAEPYHGKLHLGYFPLQFLVIALVISGSLVKFLDQLFLGMQLSFVVGQLLSLGQ